MSIAAAPAVLAEQVLAGLKGKLGVLSAFSTNLTPTAVGKTMQVSLIGGGSAKVFSKANGGYHEAEDAELTAQTVTLVHLHSTKDFAPDDLAEYGEAYMVNAFIPQAVNELVAECHKRIGNLFTSTNYAGVSNVTAAQLDYAKVVDLNTALSIAKASDARALILNSSYAGNLRKDATLVAPFNAGLPGNLVQTGTIGTVSNFGVFEFTDLPDNDQGLGGIALGQDAVCVAMALPNASMFPGEVSTASDASGISVQVLKSQGTDGIVRLSAAIRFGVGKGRASSAIRLVD